MKCLNCGKEFKAKRMTAKFCSDKCRVYSSRESVTLVELATVDGEVKVVKETPIEKKLDWEFCKHFADPKLCRFAKGGKPCK